MSELTQTLGSGEGGMINNYIDKLYGTTNGTRYFHPLAPGKSTSIRPGEQSEKQKSLPENRDNNGMIEDYTVELAREGNPDAARLLLQFAADNLAEGKTLSPEIADYLAECLTRITGGENPSTALHLGKPKNPNYSDMTDDSEHLDMVIDFWKLRESGENSEVARHLIAESWGVSESKVRKMVRNFKEAVREVMDLRKRMKVISNQTPKETDIKTFLDRISAKG